MRREPGKMIGWPGTTPWSLPEAMSEPENVTLADDRAEDDEDRGRDLHLADADAADVVVDRHERGRAAADRVEQRDELRHRRHGHAAGHDPGRCRRR